MTKYADLYVGYPVDASFTYRIPEDLAVAPGTRVRINFGNRNARGFVARVHDLKPDGIEEARIKPIESAIDEGPIFDERLTALAAYTAQNYLCSAGEVMATALPSAERPSKRYRIPFERRKAGNVSFTEEQQAAFDSILESYGRGKSNHLIFGITGSGKTEVYISLAQRMIAQGRSVIYLVPEISLSSQIFERLYATFGDELIIYHSQLTAPQRLYNWMRFYSGEAKIAIGTRSAVFLQCPSLGLIVVDEEHDGSYKEHSTPRYNARRLAAFRSKQENALLVMGSATPSMESLYAVKTGVFELHRLTSRYGEATLPEVRIVKLSRTRNPADLITNELKVLTKRAIGQGNQAIYLLNRRGFAPAVLCDECGAPLTCPFCSIGLNLHRNDTMLCHYCGFTARKPDACPACGHDELVTIGSGTQRIEEAVEETFKTARVFRLDQDTARRKDTSSDLVEKMRSGEIDILLGTQMVSKGFDFHGVTLVGVMLADIGLTLPDFRASERIFALLTQVAGRCGRGSARGTVIVQTLNEENRLFDFLKRHDYEGYAEYELSMRRALSYPPYARLARLLVRGAREEKVVEAIDLLAKKITELIAARGGDIRLLGPSPAPLARIASNYRYHLILKSNNAEAMRAVIRSARECVASRDVYLEIDIDPFDML